MTKIKEVIAYLEQTAPRSYQESYDNSGLLIGDTNTTVNGVLISLDTTEEVVAEAVKKGCNLIISHHPIIFKGLKSLTGKNYVERTILKAIKNNIALYAIHTNLDNVSQGVNYKICEKIGLTSLKILQPKSQILNKLVAFVPKAHTTQVLNALHNAGAGNIGNYSHCSFTTSGQGRFIPNEAANPTIGTTNESETVEEDRLEVIFPEWRQANIIQALHTSHPYEEVAHYITRLENKNQEVGAGMIGHLMEPMEPNIFLKHLKDSMSLPCIRHTAPSGPISKVAVCGGSGSFLLKSAIATGADAFVSADFKYHEFFDAEEKIMVADIGHYESEVYTKELLKDILSKKFTTFALNLSETVTNPISYL